MLTCSCAILWAWRSSTRPMNICSMTRRPPTSAASTSTSPSDVRICFTLACPRHQSQRCWHHGSFNMQNVMSSWVQYKSHVCLWITEDNKKKTKNAWNRPTTNLDVLACHLAHHGELHQNTLSKQCLHANKASLTAISASNGCVGYDNIRCDLQVNETWGTLLPTTREDSDFEHCSTALLMVTSAIKPL